MVVGVEDGQSMGLPTPETHCLHEAAMRRLYGIDQWLCSSDFKSSVMQSLLLFNKTSWQYVL